MREVWLLLQAQKKIFINILKLHKVRTSIIGLLIIFYWAIGIAIFNFSVGQNSNIALNLLARLIASISIFTVATTFNFIFLGLFRNREAEQLMGQGVRPSSLLISLLLYQIIAASSVAITLGGFLGIFVAVQFGNPLLVPELIFGIPILIGLITLPLAGIIIAGFKLLPFKGEKLLVGGILFGGIFLILGLLTIFSNTANFLWDTPSGIFARELQNTAKTGDWLPPLLLLMVGVIIDSTILWIFSQKGNIYFLIFEKIQEIKSLKTKNNDFKQGSPLWAYFKKELLSLKRDLAFFGQFLLPAITFLFLASVSLGVTQGSLIPSWFFPTLIAVFLGIFMMAGLGVRSVGEEGRSRWILQLLPGTGKIASMAKVIVLTIISLPLGFLLYGIMSQGNFYPYGIPIIILFIFGVAGVSLGVGAIFPKFDWTDPRKAVGIGTVLFFLLVTGILVSLEMGFLLGVTLNEFNWIEKAPMFVFGLGILPFTGLVGIKFAGYRLSKADS